MAEIDTEAFFVTHQVITVRKRSLRRLCFHRCLSVHRGREGGVRGMHAPQACMPPRHTCPQACTPLPLGMHDPPGYAPPGMHTPRACMFTPGRYYEMRSMSSRYASYWNAFLFRKCILSGGSSGSTFLDFMDIG